MTKFQKEMVDELKNRVMDYLNVASHLSCIIDDMVFVLNQDTSKEYEKACIQQLSRQREVFLRNYNPFDALETEMEIWKMLTSYPDEDEEEEP